MPQTVKSVMPSLVKTLEMPEG